MKGRANGCVFQKRAIKRKELLFLFKKRKIHKRLKIPKNSTTKQKPPYYGKIRPPRSLKKLN